MEATMALQFICGFDNVDVLTASGSGFETAIKEKWLNADLIGGTNASLVAGRISGVAMDWGNQYSKWVRIEVTGSPGTVVIGFAYYCPEEQEGADLCSIRNSSSNEILMLKMDYYNRMSIVRNTTVIAEMTEPLVPETWHYIEWKITPHDTTGSTYLRVNGLEVCSLASGDTQRYAGPVDHVVMWPQSDDVVIDDIYVLDTTGSDNNDFLGPIMIESLLPTSDTATVDWATSTGTDHYALVDEVPCTQGTDYVESATTDDQDIFNYGNLSDLDSVLGVQVWTVAAVDSGSYTLETIADDGTTQNTDSGQTVNSTTYGGFRRMLDQTPSAGAWSTALVDGSSFGVEVG
jgi:hypothetical protein